MSEEQNLRGSWLLVHCTENFRVQLETFKEWKSKTFRVFKTIRCRLAGAIGGRFLPRLRLPWHKTDSTNLSRYILMLIHAEANFCHVVNVSKK